MFKPRKIWHPWLQKHTYMAVEAFLDLLDAQTG
jgi:hypothetical protein